MERAAISRPTLWKCHGEAAFQSAEKTDKWGTINAYISERSRKEQHKYITVSFLYWTWSIISIQGRLYKLRRQKELKGAYKIHQK